MPNHLVSLNQFEFPHDLDPSKANFRALLEIRYVDGDGEVRQTKTKTLPGLDGYWELDPGERDSPRYVGPDGLERAGEGAYGTMDIGRIPLHERSVAVTASRLLSLRFRLLDVDRSDVWDVVLDKLKDVAREVGETVGELVPGEIGLADDVVSALAAKLNGSEDRTAAVGEVVPAPGQALEAGDHPAVFNRVTGRYRRRGITRAEDPGFGYSVGFSITQL